MAFYQKSLTVVSQWRISFVLEKFALIKFQTNFRTKSERSRIVRYQRYYTEDRWNEATTKIVRIILARHWWRNGQPPRKMNFFFDDGLLRRDSKGIKDTKGFDSPSGRWDRGESLFWQVYLRVISQMDFALLCRKPCGMLYFLSSRRDISVEPWREIVSNRVVVHSLRSLRAH